MAAKKKEAARETTPNGAAAFDKLKGRWLTLTSLEVVTLNADLDLAATAGLVLVDRARKPGRLELFEGLAPKYIEKGLVEHLELACEAAQHVVVESVKEEAVVTGFKVEALVVDRATLVRRRMLKCASYNLEGNEPAEKEIADIRLGSGYLDQARDLSRLAAMYGAHHAVLSTDKKNYVATDAAEAVELAQKIRDQYRASQSTENLYVAMRPKAFTEIQRLYNEVRATAEFIFRDKEDVKAEFEALRTAMASIKGRSGGGSSEDSEGETPDDKTGGSNN